MAKRKKKLVKKVEEERIKRIKIRVIGIGGGGGNIVSEIAQKVKRASFFVADTDSKALKTVSRKVEKFPFGKSFTKGLGTGMNPQLAYEAAKKEKEKIKKLFEDQDFVVLVSCLGGGVGSGATPVFSQISKNLGNLNYGIFTLPFKFEGERKMEIAIDSLKKLRGKLNAISIIPNERIFQIVDRKVPLKKALSAINESLISGLQSLIEIIYKPGLINIDFADLRTIFEGRRRLAFLNSIEIEPQRGEEVIKKVINSPLYPYGIEGAKGVLLNISGPKNLSLNQVSQISKPISTLVSKEAKIIFGLSQNQRDSKVKVSLLAVGCKQKIPYQLVGRGPKKLKKIEISEKSKKIKLRKPEVEIPKKTIPKPKEKPAPSPERLARRNALQIKKEVEEEEAKMIAEEKFWEFPTFLRKKLKTNE